MKVDLNLIEKSDYLIRSRNTGTPKEFARRLGVSVASWHNLRGEMKKWGAPIAYSKSMRTYFYKDRGSFPIGFRRISAN